MSTNKLSKKEEINAINKILKVVTIMFAFFWFIIIYNSKNINDFPILGYLLSVILIILLIINRIYNTELNNNLSDEELLKIRYNKNVNIILKTIPIEFFRSLIIIIIITFIFYIFFPIFGIIFGLVFWFYMIKWLSDRIKNHIIIKKGTYYEWVITKIEKIWNISNVEFWYMLDWKPVIRSKEDIILNLSEKYNDEEKELIANDIINEEIEDSKINPFWYPYKIHFEINNKIYISKKIYYPFPIWLTNWEKIWIYFLDTNMKKFVIDFKSIYEKRL